jgi:hypothetical protein
VQCISEGAPAGNTHFKAIVVQDLYQNLDTHSIAGKKLSEKLIDPPYKLLSEPIAEETKTLTEPTIAKKVKKSSSDPTNPKKRKKVKFSKKYPSESSSECEPSPSITFQRPTRSNHDPDKDTYFYEDDTSDEFNDIYTNVSTVRYFGEREATKPVTLSTIKDRMQDIVSTSTAPSAWGDWVMPAKMSSTSAKPPQMSAPPDSFGPARAKLFKTAQLRRKRKQLRSGQSAPDLQHVPHGADWCDADCLREEEENLPPECGYHPRFGRINFCSARCPGGWCQHTRQMDGRDFMS